MLFKGDYDLYGDDSLDSLSVFLVVARDLPTMIQRLVCQF